MLLNAEMKDNQNTSKFVQETTFTMFFFLWSLKKIMILSSNSMLEIHSDLVYLKSPRLVILFPTVSSLNYREVDIKYITPKGFFYSIKHKFLVHLSGTRNICYYKQLLEKIKNTLYIFIPVCPKSMSN